MRLLYTTNDGRLKTKTFNGAEIPQYAILSHTWKEGQEVTFADLKELESADATGVQNMEGWQKIRFCGQQARQDGLEYFWVDTCCIDKANNTELTRAINSMFRWYQNADRCYVFLTDVDNDTLEGDGEMAFRQSRWFNRGWTLQELLAPRSVEFFSKHGARLGDKESLQRIIHEVTRIPMEALSKSDLSKFDVIQRFSWAANRQTTEEEDGAYCLFGIFGVHLPLIYGEGKERALRRLKKAIDEVSEDAEGAFMNSINSQSLSRMEKLSKICTWLSAPDPSANYQKAQKQRQAETGVWLLGSIEFTNWKQNAASGLWLYGIPGCGKTILSATVVEHLLQHCHDDTSMVTAYFYFDFKDAQKQNPELMLRSLLYQLLERSLSIPKCVDALFSSCENGNRRPQLHALLEVIKQTVQGFTQVYIVLDALDECMQRLELMPVLETFARWRLDNLHLLMTSRKERDIEISLESYIKRNEAVCLQRRVVDKDIQQYVRQRLQSDRSLSKWNRDPATSQEIELALMRGACGMFRWAVCQLDMLAKCRNLAMLRKSLAALPQTLDQTYDRILSAISEEDRVYAMRILQWLTFSARPLTAKEVAEVVAIDIARDAAFDCNEVLIDPLEALDICSSLVTVTKNEVRNAPTPLGTIIALAHYSVREYLVSDRIRRGSAKEYSMQETESHKTIAEGCLKYLIQLEHPISRETHEASALARYAAEFWSHHLQNAGHETKQLNQLGMTLVDDEQPAHLSWIRLYNPKYPWKRPDVLLSLDKLDSPLQYVAILGLAEIAKLLLDKGAKVNGEGRFRCNALTWAALKGHEQMVEVLLNRGAEINAQSKQFGTALQAASGRGHERVVQMLLDRGAEVNAQNEFGGTALQVASTGGHEQVIKLLLDRGAEVNVESTRFGTALQAASTKGHEQVARILLDRGAKVNAESTRFGTALQAASARGHEQVVRMLLDRGAEVNARGGLHSTALQAASTGGYEQILELLLNRGADVNAQGGLHGTALQAALAAQHERIIETLLDNGARVDTQSDYWRELQAASAQGNKRLVKVLVNNGATVVTQSGFYGNALHAAAYHGKSAVLKFLLSRSDMRQLQDPYGRDILWWAAAGGHASTVQLLVDEYKLNPRIPDKFGRTPFEIAEKKGKIEVLHFLSRENGENGPAQAVWPPNEERVGARRCTICTSAIQYRKTYYECVHCSDEYAWNICEDCKTRDATCFNAEHVLRKCSFV